MLFRAIPHFLSAGDAKDLLDHAERHESLFEPTGLGVACDVDRSFRRSRRLRDFGPLRAEIERRVAALVPSLQRDLGLLPFRASSFDTELVAHEEGAFYRRHIDLHTDREERRAANGDRMISVVAYFFRQPRRFEGGALRLFPDPAPGTPGAETHVDIEPVHNMAVAFSSWLPHEVRPVTCPTGRFEDARFAVNCWVLC